MPRAINRYHVSTCTPHCGDRLVCVTIDRNATIFAHRFASSVITEIMGADTFCLDT